MTTGQKIAALRRKRGMTQDALAEALSVTRQAVSKWEADAALPETGKLLPLARLLGCTADYLLGSSEAEAGAPQGAPNTAAQSSEPKGAQGHELNAAAQSSEPKGAPQGSEPDTAQGAPQEPARENAAHDEAARENAAHDEAARENAAHDEAAQKNTAHDEAAREEPAQGRAPFAPYWGLPRRYVWASDFEYKSKRTLFGLPLVHINGKWGGTAKGVIAVGFNQVKAKRTRSKAGISPHLHR